MPAVVCHWLLGKRVIDSAKRLAGEERFKENSFLLGCQGPDILFYHRLVSLNGKDNLQEYGHRIHRDHPSRFFASLKRSVESCGRELRDFAHSYALGMCCHYAYDTCAHPYICQLADYMSENDGRGRDYSYHALIESALDTIMWRYETGGVISDLRLGKCVRFEKEDAAAIAHIYTDALRDIYRRKAPEEQTMLLAGDMRRLFRVLDDPTTLRLPLVMKLERMFKKDTAPMSAYMRPIMEDDLYDYANIAHEEWHNIMNAEEKSCEDFFEVTERAEKKTSEVMEFYVSTGGSESDFAEFTLERSFSNNADEEK